MLGLATLLSSSFHTAPDRTLFDCLPLFKQAGVGAIEYNDQSLPRFWKDPLDQVRAAADLARKLGLELWSAHNPCADYDVATPDEDARREAVEATKYMIRVLGRIGVRHLVVHHISGPADRDPAILEVGHGVLAELLPVAADSGVMLLIENLWNWPVARLLPTLELFGEEHLGIVVDLGHAHHSPLPVTAEREIRAAGPHLHSLHVHDNHGPQAGDEHLPPGWGTVDWPAVVRALEDVGYQGPFMMEVMRVNPRVAALSPEEAIFVTADAAREVLAAAR